MSGTSRQWLMAKWVNGRVAEILRAEGFVPLPRMWCRPEDMDLIMDLCRRHEAHVSAVRAHVAEERRKEEEKEKAWRTRTS